MSDPRETPTAGESEAGSASPKAAATGPGRRGPGAVAASVLAILLIGGFVVASPGDVGAAPAAFVVDAVVLILVFWFPAMKLASPGEVLGAWRSLIPWLLAWTLVWDLASSGVVGERAFLQEWYLVYLSGPAVVYALLMLHTWIVQRVGAAPA